jgi:LydA holin phage, holin superfamily III
MKNIPIEIIYGAIAIAGGIARYLNGYVNGERFKLRILVASAIVAGFSGFMFALLGQTMAMPAPMINVMAGVGGFFGEQTLKFIMEYAEKKLP